MTANEQAYLTATREVPCLIKVALINDAKSLSVVTPGREVVSAAAASPASIRATVRVDGKINFKGATLTLAQFKSKLQAMVTATPDQTIVIRAGKTVSYQKLKDVFDCCRDVDVRYVSTATLAPLNPSGSSAPGGSGNPDLPAPGLLMHPSLEPISTNSTENIPITNAPASSEP